MSLNAVGAAAAQAVDKIQFIQGSSVPAAFGETQNNVPKPSKVGIIGA